MRRIEDVTLDELKDAYPADFYASAITARAELEALQDRVADSYMAEIERRLIILREAYPRHTFHWSSGNGSAYVLCESPRGPAMRSLYARGFLNEPFMRCEWQMKDHGSYHRMTPARHRALLILWQEVEAIMALHLDADESFNVTI